MKRLVAIVIAALVVGGVVGAVAVAAAGDEDSATAATHPTPRLVPATTASRPAGGSSAEAVYRSDAPGVVVITDTQTQKVPATLFSPPSKQQVGALGSGFVIDRRGDIVTNDHVVQGARNIRVGFTGSATYPATVVGADPSTDIAVVRVNAPASALRPLAFASSNDVAVGEQVYAIGNPFGLDRTMTAGIVSAVHRDIQAPNGLLIPDAIQTDAAINHGNSGGPLLGASGRVIGVNSQIQGGTVDANVGVAFAVPSDTAHSIAQQLIEHGHVEHAWLGVGLATIDPTLRAVPGLPAHGVVVTSVVAGSPAAKAGLRAATRQVTVRGITVPEGGDVIVGIDGKPVDSSTQIATDIARDRPGDRVTLKVVRDGEARTDVATLAAVPASSSEDTRCGRP
jgi:S1-C subfamily serine protease